MKTYKEVFTFYEDKDIHKQIQEVEELELKVSSLYGDIRRYLNDETVERLDSLIGQISRAYELQGFAFAQEVYQKKSDEDKAKAEELALQELKMSRKKKILYAKNQGYRKSFKLNGGNIMEIKITVERRRSSVTQGMAYVLINGKEVVRFADTIEIIPPGADYYGELIGGWASVEPDTSFIKGMIYHYNDTAVLKKALDEIEAQEQKGAPTAPNKLQKVAEANSRQRLAEKLCAEAEAEQ